MKTILTLSLMLLSAPSFAANCNYGEPDSGKELAAISKKGPLALKFIDARLKEAGWTGSAPGLEVCASLWADDHGTPGDAFEPEFARFYVITRARQTGLHDGPAPKYPIDVEFGEPATAKALKALSERGPAFSEWIDSTGEEAGYHAAFTLFFTAATPGKASDPELVRRYILLRAKLLGLIE